VCGQHHAPAALPPGTTRYLLYRRLGGPQGRSGRVRKMSPPTGIRSPDRPARSQSLYRRSYPAHYGSGRSNKIKDCCELWRVINLKDAAVAKLKVLLLHWPKETEESRRIVKSGVGAYCEARSPPVTQRWIEYCATRLVEANTSSFRNAPFCPSAFTTRDPRNGFSWSVIFGRGGVGSFAKFSDSFQCWLKFDNSNRLWREDRRVFLHASWA
jgi:hypothetical protein